MWEIVFGFSFQFARRNKPVCKRGEYHFMLAGVFFGFLEAL